MKNKYFKTISIILLATLFFIGTFFTLKYYQSTKLSKLSDEPTTYKGIFGLNLKIDTTIKKTSGDYQYKNSTNTFKTYFKSNPTTQEAIKFEKNGSSLSFSTLTQQSFGNLDSGLATISQNQVTYQSIFPQIDLIYSVSPTSLLEEFIVHDAKTAIAIDRIDQIAKPTAITTHTEKDGAIYFKNGDKDVLILPSPVLYEIDDRSKLSYGIKYEISQENDIYKIAKIITPEGKDWLSDPSRKYPIVIDPVVIDNADTTSNWVSSDPTNTTVSQETTIKNGGTGSVKIQTSNSTTTTTFDLMEYSSNGLAQAAYITSGNPSATGGTITSNGGYTIHTFTSSGTFAVTGSLTVDSLIVGGGGNGKSTTTLARGGGGGGGGAVQSNTNQSLSTNSYAVTVGAAAQNSVFNGITAQSGYTGAQAGGSSGNGYPGASGYSDAGGGGGGNSGGGSNGYDGGTGNDFGGGGGQGTASSITGTSIVYGSGGGGGGAGRPDTAEANGAAGGANAGTGGNCGYTAAYVSGGGAGVANRGGGGGGGGYCSGAPEKTSTGGAGGSGIVVVRYLTPPYLLAYSEPTIKTEGSYSLKAVANQTTSLNRTLTKSISAMDLTGQNSIQFSLRASRTGSNIKVGVVDSGGTVSEVTPNITVADTFQTVNLDLTGVSNANKDAITSIVITVVNADATNTFYLDNMLVSGSTSANDTVTLTTAPTDLSTASSITFWVRSTVAGSFARVELGETTSSEQSSTFTINAPNTWEQKTWDISAIAAASRNAVTKFAIRITGTTSGASIYLDDLNSFFPPFAPTIGTGTAQSESVIRWNFTDNSNNEDGFKVYDGSDNLMATCIGQNLTYCDEAGLIPNTSYTRKVVAYNGDGSSSYSALSSAVYTLAIVPSAPTVGNRLSASISVNPNPSTNPSTTTFAIYKEIGSTCDGSGGVYLAANGSDNGSTAVWQTDSAWGTVSSTGLNAETIYTFCVKAKNANNVETSFSEAGNNNAGIVPIGGDFPCQDALSINTLTARYPDGNSPGRYIVGVDAGSSNTNSAKFEIKPGCSLAMNTTDTLVTGTLDMSGGSITNIGSGAKIVIGQPLWIVDTDGDGYSSDGKVYYGTAPVGGRRKSLASTLSTTDCNDSALSTINLCQVANGAACSYDGICVSGICGTNIDGDSYFSLAAGHTGTCQAIARAYTDCYDSNANAYPSSPYCGTTNRGDGSFDYNCSSTTTTCGTTYYTSTPSNFWYWNESCNAMQNCTSTCLYGGTDNTVSSAAGCGVAGYRTGTSIMRYTVSNCTGYNARTLVGTPGTQACN